MSDVRDMIPVGRPPLALDRDVSDQTDIAVVYDWNLTSDTISWAPNFETLEGLPAREALRTGLNYAEHLAVESPLTRYDAVMAPGGIDSGDGVSFQAIYGIVIPGRSKTAPVWVEDTGRWFAEGGDRPTRVHGSIRLITERFERERLLAAASVLDPETGASTRSHFIAHVEAQLDIAARKSLSFAILLVGVRRVDGGPLDGALLAKAVTRLRGQMRTNEIVAVVAPAKLGVLLEGCSADQSKIAAQRLLDALHAIDPDSPALSAGIGAVMAPCHGRSPLALLQYAEEALDVAQQPTSPSYIRFEPDTVRARVARVDDCDELPSALNDGRVLLALQPVIEAKTGKVAFQEALVRIRRLDGTLIMPDALVPDAEKNGLISLVDRRVIDLAFYRLTADRRVVLSINPSVASLRDAGWLDHLRACCRLRPDGGRRLTVEVSETSAMADIEATKTVLTAIKALGVKIAIGNFGSGHSSFRSLSQLPIDYLKIDGAFTLTLSKSTDDHVFMRAQIDLARNLGIPIVAEWVEDEATAQLLTEWGVDYLQGYLFGKPEIAPEVVMTARERVVR